MPAHAEGTPTPASPAKSASAGDLLAATAASAASGVYAEEDDTLLATLKRSPIKKRHPAAKWDGRVGGMSLQEYRERKWSVDAGFGKIFRGGPTYSMRKMTPSSFTKRNNNFQVGDVFRGMNATSASSPSFSMGVQYFTPPISTSQGPAEYQIKSSMDPSKHPTISKNTGARFGSEVLEPRDPAGPAPGDYDVNAIVHSSAIKKPPNFTIPGREAWAPRSEAPGPGVGEYKYEKATRLGKLTPIHWTAQGKTEPLEKPLGSRQFIGPGPPHYNCPGAGAKTHPSKLQAPVWKFGSEARGLRN